MSKIVSLSGHRFTSLIMLVEDNYYIYVDLTFDFLKLEFVGYAYFEMLLMRSVLVPIILNRPTGLTCLEQYK